MSQFDCAGIGAYVRHIPNRQSRVEQGVEQLNTLPESEAHAVLLTCCGSQRWAAQMVEARPFASRRKVRDKAVQSWNTLDPVDWVEAFSAHPRIGASLADSRAKARPDWSSDEQEGARVASNAVSTRLAEGNKVYEARFGFIFIICATGMTGEEMLHSLESRLANERESEIRIAATEQMQITLLRIDKMLADLRVDD